MYGIYGRDNRRIRSEDILIFMVVECRIAIILDEKYVLFIFPKNDENVFSKAIKESMTIYNVVTVLYM